jgi:DNA-directed RNA polymerase specialized sigma24 family protein
MKRERSPTSEEFEKLLGWIDPDREAAGHKFQLILSRITRSFISRGCIDAETLTDEVSNRVAVRIEKVIQTYPDPLHCLLGFIDNVHREYLREQREQAYAQAPPPPRPAEVLESEDECLTECMGTLPAKERDLFSRYFAVDKAIKIQVRTALAEELNLTPNALRIKAHRLRKRLLDCVQICLERTGA